MGIGTREKSGDRHRMREMGIGTGDKSGDGHREGERTSWSFHIGLTLL